MDQRDSGLSQRPFAEVAELLKQYLKRLGRKDRAGRQDQASPPESPPVQPPALDLETEMAGVKPLARDNYMPRHRRAPMPALQDGEAEALAHLADLVEGRIRFDILNSDEYVEGIAHGLDRGLLTKLRKGTFAIQAHLDLHGRTRQEAREEVSRFLTTCRGHRMRCVLIVHGRGLNSKDQIPVLKQSLKVWLTGGGMGRWVLAFCTALPSDGGAGAIYVLLRK